MTESGPYCHGEDPNGDNESERVRAAAQRLNRGEPLRSNGSITVSSLAKEAGISRQRLYEQHADLITEFRGQTSVDRSTRNQVAALENQLADAHSRIRTLESEKALLRDQLRTLRAVIVELTVETEASNIVQLKRS